MTQIPDSDPFSAAGGSTGILVSHGFSGSPKSMKPWARHLAEAGYTVELPRLPGHGTSWQDMNRTRWEDWYGEVDRVVTDLEDRCENVFVMGLSMGGTLCLRLAEEHPELSGVVVVNPAVHTERPDRFVLPIIRHVVPAFPGISNDIKKPGVDEGAYTKLPLQAAYSLTKLWEKVKADVSAIKQPILVFRSAEDHVVEPSNAQWVIDNVASDDITFIELENSYHVATLDYDAQIIFDESVEFIERVLSEQG